VHHRNGGDSTADLVKYELTGDTAFNPYLLDGDIVHVPFPGTMIKVSGAVRRPGMYELVGAKDVAELVELAGGLAPTAAKAMPIRIVRRNAQQQDTYIDVPVGGNATLVDDDKVVVRGTDDLQRTVLLIGAVVGSDPLDSATTSRRLPFVEGDTVWSLIDRAGGIKAPGDLRRSYIARPKPSGQDLVPIDLDALLVRRDFKADKPIAMGDTIVIPPMQYSVMVEGAVGRAGLYNYNPVFGVPEYIAHAGGMTRTARDLDEVTLIEANGSTRAYHGGMKLQPGDAILVPERNFSRGEVAQLVLAAAGLALSGVAIVLAARR
jgi:polysaccharide export outer membrane protein